MRVLVVVRLIALWGIGMLLVSPAAAELRAGASKVDITPQPGVSLDGPISKNGPVESVHDPLHARALVLSDGMTEMAIVVCDACMIGGDVFQKAKRLANEATGMPATAMLISATHTHAAPRAVHIGNEPIDDRYHQTLAERIARAIEQAHENLAPAQIGHASFGRGDLLACRRLLCEPGSVGPNPFGETGERVKSVAGRSTRVIEPAGPVDPEFSVVSVQHADGAPLCVLGNFSVHYCGGYRRGVVSADYFGAFAQGVETRLAGDRGDHPPVVGIMSNGTSGNAGSFRRSSGKKFAPFERMEYYGRLLASDAIEAIDAVSYREDVTLSVEQTDLTFAVRRPDPDRLRWARRVLKDPEAERPHRWSDVYAHEAQHLAGYPETVTLPLQALRIGEIAIAAAPCEVFAETGLAVKAASL